MVLISLVIILPMQACAESYINENGIEISEEEYANYLKVFTPEHIRFMSESEYERMQDLDFNDIRTSTKYVISTYNPNLEITTHREVSKEEYDNFKLDDEENLRLGNGNCYRETTAKSLSMTVIGGSPWSYASLSAHWKYIPNTRSYDVIGFRGDGFSFRNGSQSGEQRYYLSGSYHYVNYSWNGTNIKKFSNGFGISMNIVNSSIESLDLSISCDIKDDITHPELFGSYQHATSNLTLANSQNYTLGSAGLGWVFVYPYNISSKYDGMGGVVITY